MCITEAIQKRLSLNLEIDALKSMENQLHEQIKKLALRACINQPEHMVKVERLAALNSILRCDA
jgi:hypothetical protein